MTADPESLCKRLLAARKLDPLVLVIIGGINWGLVYVLVGLSALRQVTPLLETDEVRAEAHRR